MIQTRIDKWLFHARFFRTRPLAQAATVSGRVRLNGTRVEKPGRAVRPGDVLTLGKGGDVVAVRVVGVAERRASALQARDLYEVLDE